jgi:uncharacterized protein
MSEYLNKEEQKKKIVKDVIVRLHEGLSVEEAKSIIEEKVGTINSSEIAEIEQSLINEGMSTDEIKKFCNVHALLFESSLHEIVAKEESEGHPIYLFKLENREIEKKLEGMKAFIKSEKIRDLEVFKKNIKELLLELSGVHLHYERKEQLLFPFLEKYGFMGPSKVMWGKDNEIRDMLKDSLSKIEDLVEKEQIEKYIEKNIVPLLEEVEGMIFKEENILFPSSQEKLKPRDWIDIIKESDDIGYVFIQKPKETAAVVEDLKRSVVERPQLLEEGSISFPTGVLQLKEMMLMLNALPVDITFIDKDDTVRYFSDNKDRAFVRTRTVIGRKVQNCHPPQSVDVVEKILASFKERKRDSADFWINFKDRFIYIKFFALRDEALNYIGTMEVTMDATEIRGLEGEKRLLDEGD